MSNVVVPFPARTPGGLGDNREYVEWLQKGIENGYCSEVRCLVHVPLDLFTDEEAEQMFDEGEPDHCVFGVRLHET